MARIETYAFDSNLSLDDFVIGSDADNTNVTRNYPLSGLFSTFKTALNLASIEFTFSDGTDPTLDESDAGYFTTNGNETAAAAVTAINLNTLDGSNIDIRSLLEVVDDQPTAFTLRVFKASVTGQVFYFAVSAVTDNLDDTWTLTVSNFVGGNTLIDATTYSMVFDLSGVPSIYTETDPIFLASPAGAIIAGDITNWNTAFGWGDHSVAGYLDTDQTTPQTVSNGAPIFGAGLESTYILLDTTYTITGAEPQGSIYFNADEETIDVVMNGAVLQVGQEIVYHVRNNSGLDIADGDAVMATGTIGNSSRITIAAMLNDGTVNPDYFLGVATEAITNGTDGKVTSFGKVRGIDTTGIPYSETWNDGDLIYLDPNTAGHLTNIQPPAVGGMTYKAPIAIVIHAHANGTLFIRVSGNQGIHELHDVEITTIANEDVIRWNTSTLRWENYSSTNWDLAVSWGDHSAQGYLTSFTETDPVFVASDAYPITTADINSWDAAYQWGDHAVVGYLEEVFITGSTGATDSGNWTKIATVTLGARYDNASAFIGYHNSTNTQGEVRTGFLSFRVRQEAAFGADPALSATSWFIDETSVDIGYVIVQNTPTTIVDFYVQPNNSYTTVHGTAISMDGTTDITWYSGGTYATTPAGIVESSSISIGVTDHTLLSNIGTLTHAQIDTALTGLTATPAELNLLDLSGLTVGWVLSADSATTASWKAPTGGGAIGGSITDNQVAVGATTADDIEGSANLTWDLTTLLVEGAVQAEAGYVSAKRVGGTADTYIAHLGNSGTANNFLVGGSTTGSLTSMDVYLRISALSDNGLLYQESGASHKVFHSGLGYVSTDRGSSLSDDGMTVFTAVGAVGGSILTASNTTGSTGFPSVTGQGLYIKGASSPRDFAFWRTASTTNDGLWYGNKNSGDTAWEWFQIFHEHTNSPTWSSDTADNNWTIQSIAGVSLHLEADTDNTTETDNVHILMSQDGGIKSCQFGLTGAANVPFTGTASNDTYFMNYTAAEDYHFGFIGATRSSLIVDNGRAGIYAGEVLSDGSIATEHSAKCGYVLSPEGAFYSATTNLHTGAFRINLPSVPTGTSGNSADMIMFSVNIYDYGGGDGLCEAIKIDIAGYPHVGGWANTSATIHTIRKDKNYSVRFYYDATNHYVYIGETSSTWGYPQVTVNNLQVGYNAVLTEWLTGWSIDAEVVSLTGTADHTVSNNLPTAGRLVADGGTVTLEKSTTRVGLIKVGDTTNRSWHGYSIEDDAGQEWSIMGNATAMGIFDETNANWHVYCAVNSYTRLYYNNSAKLATGSGGITVTGDGTATDWNLSSDERLKYDIEPLGDYEITTNWVKYKWKDTDREDIGVIAQDIEKTNPEFVKHDDYGMKSVSYTKLLVAKMAEKDKQVAKLEYKNKQLGLDNIRFKTEIEELNKRMDRLEGLLTVSRN